MTPFSRGSWAGLPPELVQLACAKADDGSRLNMMFVCTAWRAAVLAAPHLVPAPVVELPEAAAGARAQERVLSTAAALNPLTWRVVVKGAAEEAQAQPFALTAVLAVLPSHVRQLHIECDCNGLVLRMLQRFPRLEGLELGGNAAFADWRGAGPVAAKLQGGLTINCRRAGGTGHHLDDELENFPVGLPQALSWASSHATALHTLVLDSVFDAEAAAFCSALPAIRILNLTLRYGRGAEAAVAMLRQLPQLHSLQLQLINVETHFDPDADGASWIGNGVWEWMRPPPLAGLPLHSLTVQGAVGLPPDWRQLASLQVLRVVSSPEYGEPLLEEDETSRLQWGSEPAGGLAALTRLEIKGIVPDVEVVASMPALQVVRDIKGRQPGWRTALAAARPNLEIIPY
ncbi:2-polyprenyl-6-methoxyphenol hydroxylase [Chlorella sorokiniana]|uniref:2-polyprenyl-6-methoxyphenol hydroxylase n=1 Tax=Chlorella sorokiniana TaxID=3076 RepID=A0A2P6TBX1_CHLSO|nr:2-polyprenyl-6-methoxyphenol hydroxylase [Chlorella sorokiniana]|eukprot:PRW18384.1 2-polyprenyl-6-methoxyphenol hydroxylase [Chlorella sorokiniana]